MVEMVPFWYSTTYLTPLVGVPCPERVPVYDGVWYVELRGLWRRNYSPVCQKGGH